jgi:uncharacterized protein YjeT (DUF2065 family)
MKSVIAVAICVCLVMAPMADAQAATLVDTIIKGCTSGMTSTLCKGAMSRATAMCKSKDGSGNCVKMFTDLCNVSDVVMRCTAAASVAAGVSVAAVTCAK